MKIKNKKNKKKVKLDSLKRILPTSIVIFLMIALLLIPVPFIKISPGPLFNTVGKEMDQEVISINGVKTYASKGELNFTTVSETGALICLLALNAASAFNPEGLEGRAFALNAGNKFFQTWFKSSGKS